MKLRIAAALSLSLVLAACTNGRSTTGTDPAARVVPNAAPGGSGALDAAHRAYLEGDWIAVGERVRDVLLDPSSSELVKQNAYELLDRSYEATKGTLPTAYGLPPGFVDLQYGAINGTTPHGTFSKIWVRGRTVDASRLVGLTLRRLPDDAPLLDKNRGQGPRPLQRLMLPRFPSGFVQAPVQVQFVLYLPIGVHPLPTGCDQDRCGA